MKMSKGPQHLLFEKRPREIGAFSVGKRRLKGIISMCGSYYLREKRVWEAEPDSCQQCPGTRLREMGTN